MDQLLISNSRHIRLANRFGLSKMLRNILALQQNLKNIGDTPLEVDFERSRRFWDVFAAGPKVRRVPIALPCRAFLTQRPFHFTGDAGPHPIRIHLIRL